MTAEPIQIGSLNILLSLQNLQEQHPNASQHPPPAQLSAVHSMRTTSPPPRLSSSRDSSAGSPSAQPPTGPPLSMPPESPLGLLPSSLEASPISWGCIGRERGAVAGNSSDARDVGAVTSFRRSRDNPPASPVLCHPVQSAANPPAVGTMQICNRPDGDPQSGCEAPVANGHSHAARLKGGGWSGAGGYGSDSREGVGEAAARWDWVAWRADQEESCRAEMAVKAVQRAGILETEWGCQHARRHAEVEGCLKRLDEVEDGLIKVCASVL
jgi:hypothetical protein